MNAVDDAILLAKVIWDDPQSGETLELVLAEGDKAGIGRLETNAICIKEQHVSRQHAEIPYADGIFVIKDLGSANGVYVNGARVRRAELHPGDHVQICGMEFDIEAPDANVLRSIAAKLPGDPESER